MRIVRLINGEHQLIWRNNVLKISLIYEDSINNIFLEKIEKGKIKYQTYNGKLVKNKESFEPEEVLELGFSIFCNFQNCSSTNIKTVYRNVNDHPFCVWRRKKSGWLEYYQELFRRFNTTEVNFSRDFELYDRIALLKDENFERLCLDFFDQQFLFEETDFFRRLFIILTSEKITIDKIREKTSWIRTKKITSILMSLLAIVPACVEEYIEEMKTLNYDFTNTNINEMDYIFQVCKFDNLEFILLVDFLLNSGMNMNLEVLMEKLEFSGNFISIFEKFVKIENRFSVEVYSKLALKYNFANLSDVSISFRTVAEHRENCIQEFHKYDSCYINIFVITKTLFILGISVNLEDLKNLKKHLYRDYLQIFMSSKKLPDKLSYLIFSFLNPNI